jgi:hypothetical protein
MKGGKVPLNTGYTQLEDFNKAFIVQVFPLSKFQ